MQGRYGCGVDGGVRHGHPGADWYGNASFMVYPSTSRKLF